MLANEKFARAISLATSLSPASHACSALVAVANIMKDAARVEDAIRVLDAAAEHPDRIAEAVFSDRRGIVLPGSVKHSTIAQSWARDLKDRIRQARISLASKANADDVFLGYLLHERKKQSLCDMLRTGDFVSAVDTIRRAVVQKQDSALDLVLTLSACSATVSHAAEA